VAEWVARKTLSIVTLNAIVSLGKKLYPRCLVLVDSRNRFESDTVKLKWVLW